MRHVVTVLLLALASSGLAHSGIDARLAEFEARVAALEARVSHLEATLAVPAPPPTTLEVNGFTFSRLDARQTSIGLELVGEVTAADTYESVTFRVTYYAEDGSILETGTFSVERIGPTPRTFDTGMFSDVRIDQVVTIRIEVERIR